MIDPAALVQDVIIAVTKAKLDMTRLIGEDIPNTKLEPVYKIIDDLALEIAKAGM